jgi:nucleoside-diphosphate-sugar epimerase
MIIDISGKQLVVQNIKGPVGVMGRNSDNQLIKQKLGWAPCMPLQKGIQLTYNWIKKQLA